ncbi:MAG: flagellar export chaperone FlgN, partial [Planctomycetota bacterium]
MSVSTETSSWVASLVELLGAQRDLLGELVPLAEQQGRLIEHGDSAALLDLLSRRQDVIDRFLALADELSVHTGDLTRRLETLPDAIRSDVRCLVDEIDRRLARVMELDQRDQQRLKAARDETRKQLSTLDTGRTARSAYVQPPAGRRYTD